MLLSRIVSVPSEVTVSEEISEFEVRSPTDTTGTTCTYVAILAVKAGRTLTL